MKPYNPHRSPRWNFGGEHWKLSRFKIERFQECPRCFYIDNIFGTKRPDTPPFKLNEVVDTLLKRECDAYRARQEAHPVAIANNLSLIPFQHTAIDQWRDNFTGIQTQHESTGMTISGAIDDVWQHPDGTLCVIDYKATAKPHQINDMRDEPMAAQYRRQMGVYQWLLRQNGFPVHDRGYFLYANCKQDREAFEGQLDFELTLVPCDGATDWIEETLHAIHRTLTSEEVPEADEACAYCQYRNAAGKKLLERQQRQREHKETRTTATHTVNHPNEQSPLF
jgi:RecB family exonuclease